MKGNRKKKKTLTELAVGGGLTIIFLPLILLAVFWTIVAIGLGLTFTFVLSGNPAVFLPMLLVYGALLVIIVFVSVRFSQRFRVLFQRWRGIRHERRRVAALAGKRLSVNDELVAKIWEDDESDRSGFQQTH